ncbi:hypothetical protein ACFLRO_02280 [Bacteroidota bacterium]
MKKEALVPALLLAAMIVWSLLAPVDATLGTAFRWVYLHVAFTWAGSSMVNVAALLGIVLVIRPMPRLSEWFFALEIVAVGLYTFGFVLSLISSWTSWGGILWQEPRVVASILVIGFGVSVVFVIRTLKHVRLIGLVALVYAALVGYQLSRTSVIFHPDNAVGATESTAITFTFYGLAILATALGVLLVRQVGRRNAE